jgi:hypothetical protein
VKVPAFFRDRRLCCFKQLLQPVLLLRGIRQFCR